MFTAEQALKLPQELQIAFAEDVNKFFTAYTEACELFRAEGIKAKEMQAGYPARSWQQVAELLHFFTSRKLVFAFEFTNPVPIAEGLYSITGYVYGLYGLARIPVYSGSHIIMPISTTKQGYTRFDDKAIGGAERYVWKNFFLHVSGIADGEKDIDDTPAQEINQDDMPLSKESATDEANRVVRELVEKGLYPTEEDVKAQIKSYNLDKTTIRTINYYRQLQSRLEKDAKKNG